MLVFLKLSTTVVAMYRIFHYIIKCKIISTKKPLKNSLRGFIYCK